MNGAKLDAKEIFLGALDCATPEELAGFLEESCAGDAALRARVEQLLASRREAGSFLGGDWTAATEAISPLVEAVGMVIGPYKLLQQIGEGGMGVVFMAEQSQPVQRTVALKIIKPGMDTRQVIARFEAERQAVAMMDHPNIARVLDAGTTDTGRPYFVMDLVKGVPITDYCDQQQLPIRERLELISAVCHAVQHAHQKGIIHRDLKPSNVLVAEYDGKPVPKIIDFGVAKATAQRLTEKTMFTEYGQLIGTFEYMSPEQARFNQLDVDTRSDIYSLGVLLYELLAGSTPLEKERLRAAAFDEVLRIICEEDPPLPSTRLSSSLSLPSIAANRSLEPKKLSGLVRGELDWIVMKCLEKDRNRRYETASGLAADIGHHLNDEPVAARPASNLYRFRKTVRRNKAAFAAGGAVIAALIVGLGLSTWLFVREKAARQRAVAAERLAEIDEQKARTEAAKSQQVAQFLKDMLDGSRPGVAAGRDTTLLREIVDRTAQRVGNDLKNQPEVEAELRRTLGWVYEILGEYEQAEAMFRQAVVVGKKHFGNEHLEVAESLGVLGFVLMRQGKLAEAEATFREALATQRKLLSEENQELAFSLNGLAGVLRQQRKLAEAEAMFRESLAMRRKLFGNDDPIVANVLNNLGESLCEQGYLAEAETMYREALAIIRKHPDAAHDVSSKLWNLANLLQQQGKLAEAEATYHEALAMQRSLLGNDHPFVAGMLEGLAGALQQQAKFTEAETTYREALVARRKAVESTPNNPAALSGLARMLATCPVEPLRDPDRAVELAARVTELAPQTGSCWTALGVAQYRNGECQAAIEAFDRSMELRAGGDATEWFFLTMAHQRLGNKEIARRYYDKAVEWMEKTRPNDEELGRFCAEAAELLGIPQPQPSPNTKLQGEH